MSVATGNVAREQLAIAAFLVAALAALTLSTIVDASLSGAAVLAIIVSSASSLATGCFVGTCSAGC